MEKTSPAAATAAEPTMTDDAVKYKGVRLRKWGKYVSEIRLPNSRERIWLGSHDTAEKAARAFDAALFCLRGAGAKFNFPDDPPSIAGGQALTPAEIQAVAQNYANGFRTGSSSNNPVAPLEDHELELRSSNSDPIDWLSSEHSSWSLVFDEYYPEQMYMPSHIGENDAHANYDDDNDGGNGGSEQPLWSFW